MYLFVSEHILNLVIHHILEYNLTSLVWLVGFDATYARMTTSVSTWTSIQKELIILETNAEYTDNQHLHCLFDCIHSKCAWYVRVSPTLVTNTTNNLVHLKVIFANSSKFCF
jgi:hypothetical protein